MPKKYLNNKGMIMIDGIISVLILAIFTTVIVNLIYRVYLQAQFVKRNSVASMYVTDILEFFDKTDYEQIENTVHSKIREMQINTLYTVSCKIYAYTPDSEDEWTIIYEGINENESWNVINTQDINSNIKKIEVKVKFNVGKKEREITMQRLKQK